MSLEPMTSQELNALLELSRGEIVHVPEPRKTLRDEFAMAALQGFLAADYGGSTVELCEATYEVADAMMAERTRQAKGE